MRWYVVMWVGRAAAVASGGCVTCSSGLSCSDVVGFSAQLDVLPSDLSGASVELCQNAKCWTAVLGSVSDEQEQELQIGPACAAIDVTPLPGGMTKVQLSPIAPLTHAAQYECDKLPCNDGDIYQTRIINAYGTVVLATTTAPITYVVLDICGSECHQASVQLPTP